MANSRVDCFGRDIQGFLPATREGLPSESQEDPMHRIFVPSLGPADWRRLLADPVRQWKRGRSAWELAVSWESQRETKSGLPTEIQNALRTHADFEDVRLLIAIPEHQVELDDARRPSQSDVWALLLAGGRHLSLTVEAKAGEEFDRTVGDWNKSQSEGKARRLQFLRDQLGIEGAPLDDIRYQLLHRTAASLLEARRWSAAAGIMIVQSFAESSSSWSDFEAFARIVGAPVKRGAVVPCAVKTDVPLFIGWVDSSVAPDSLAAGAV